MKETEEEAEVGREQVVLLPGDRKRAFLLPAEGVSTRRASEL